MASGRPPSSSRRSAVWYEGGLQFGCRRCNACCGGAPGYVWVDDDEIARMAVHLAMSVAEFTARYCRRVWWRVSLKEMDNGDCVFVSPDGCRVYPVRPVQCRSFPFWPDMVDSRQVWEAQRGRCPGVGRGRLYSRQEIDQIGRGERDT